MGFLIKKWNWIIKTSSDVLINIADWLYPVEHTFHDNVVNTSEPNGNIYHNIDDREVLTFSIGGTTTAQVYEFRTIDHVGNDSLVTCYRLEDSEAGKGTSVKGETWQAPIKGVPYFYVKLISKSVGTCLVKGEAGR